MTNSDVVTYDELSSTILAALSLLDQKGTNEKITQAMTIVYEAFRLSVAKCRFSAEDLCASAHLHTLDL